MQPKDGAQPMVLVENWTKWRLFVNDSTPTEEPPRVVFGNSAAKLPLQDSVIIFFLNLCFFAGIFGW